MSAVRAAGAITAAITITGDPAARQARPPGRRGARPAASLFAAGLATEAAHG
ncbi:MAG TPA: hypothetical protein VN840_06590 [Streptosporangiaceae bacterium]|nr:hypothetical protein [Streptosporangiaceae bacterium]